jgi:D-cysteine desulfhydrase
MEAINCSDEYYQPGYMLPNPGMIEAVRRLAQIEGILLDPGYSGKATAGLIDLVRKGYFKKDENILFIHTGGAPALYAYLDTFLDNDKGIVT